MEVRRMGREEESLTRTQNALDRPVKELVDSITRESEGVDGDFRKKVAAYAGVRAQLAALDRKAAGTLMTRSLVGLVAEADYVASENLTTQLVVVKRHQVAEFLAGYETLAPFVVPRSAKLMVEEGDFALYAVVLFKRSCGEFKSAAAKHGFHQRDYEYAPGAVSGRTMERDELEAAQLAAWTDLARCVCF